MNSHCLFGHWVLSIAFSVFDLLEKSIQTFLLFSSITWSPFLLCGASVCYSQIFYSFFLFCFMYLNLFFKWSCSIDRNCWPRSLCCSTGTYKLSVDSSVFCEFYGVVPCVPAQLRKTKITLGDLSQNVNIYDRKLQSSIRYTSQVRCTHMDHSTVAGLMSVGMATSGLRCLSFSSRTVLLEGTCGPPSARLSWTTIT